MKWTNISKAERDEISILRDKGYSMRSIAKSLGRSPNTVSYELRHNKTGGRYDPKKAGMKSRLRKRMRRLQWMKIEEDGNLKKYIIESLEGGWNPDEIAGRMKREWKPYYASRNSIYRWLYSYRGQKYCSLLYSKRHRRKPRGKSKKRALIPKRIGIAKRFKGAANRTRYGHWEKDAVVSRQGISASLAVAEERKTKLVLAKKVKNMSPADHEAATQKMIENKKALSITRDNGIENIYHAQTPVPSFFCDPYSSWQKGGIENANKLIRKYFPKGTDFRKITQTEVDRVINLINEKPRRILGYRSAIEAAEKAGIIKSIKSEGVLIQG